MATLIRNVRVIDCLANVDVKTDVVLSKGSIVLAPKTVPKNVETFDGEDKILIPGLIDLHVHFREPGFTYKEDIASGIRAALAGGVTSALVMPNTYPAIDNAKRVHFQFKRAQKTGFDIMVASAASIGLLGREITDIASVRRAGAKAVTDDGKPILETAMMEEVLRLCRKHDLVCMQHAEDLRISRAASLHEGKVSFRANLEGQPSRAEYSIVKRDIELAKKLDARYHVLHLSCKESLDLVREAKRHRARVSCEVSPHHLLLSEQHASGLDTYKKMNPPLRMALDADYLLNGLCDGTIDAVASDHAPHAKKEKRAPFLKAPFGVVGLETAFLVLLTLVKKRGLPLKRAIESMTTGPARILDDTHRIGTMLSEQALKNAVLIDPHFCAPFSERRLFGKSKNSAFIGMELFGHVVATFLDGELVHRTH